MMIFITQLKNRMKDLIEGFKIGFQIDVNYEMMDFYPVVYNDLDLVDHLLKTFK